MSIEVRRLVPVWTSDGRKLGLGQRLYRRTEGVDPANLLYERYLEVENYELGSTYFVPTDFIGEKDDAPGELKLNKTFREVQDCTWFRMPDFVVRGQCQEEPLSEE